MAVAFDAVSYEEAEAATSISKSHTGTGSSLVGWVILGFTQNVSEVSATYGGQAMTLVAAVAPGYWLHCFYIDGALSGAQTVAASWTTSANCQMGIMTYSGAVANAAAKASATGTSTTPTVNVSSAAGEVVVDGVIGGGTVTVGADQTQRYNRVVHMISAGSEEAGAGTVTMSWTQESSWWGIVAMPLQPAVAESGFFSFF